MAAAVRSRTMRSGSTALVAVVPAWLPGEVAAPGAVGVDDATGAAELTGDVGVAPPEVPVAGRDEGEGAGEGEGDAVTGGRVTGGTVTEGTGTCGTVTCGTVTGGTVTVGAVTGTVGMVTSAARDAVIHPAVAQRTAPTRITVLRPAVTWTPPCQLSSLRIGIGLRSLDRKEIPVRVECPGWRLVGSHRYGPSMAHVAVIGSGVAGLASGLALGELGHEVTILERDPAAPPTDTAAAFDGWDRPGVPQERQSHAFLARLRLVLQEQAPDLLDELFAAGITEIRFMDFKPPTLSDHDPRPGDEQLVALACRRPVF
jgi:hypothetical protein